MPCTAASGHHLLLLAVPASSGPPRPDPYLLRRTDRATQASLVEAMAINALKHRGERQMPEVTCHRISRLVDLNPLSCFV